MPKIDPKTTNFVVTGLARSGTTYMMRCIEAGGIPVVSQSWRYGIRGQDVRPVDFNKYKGKCCKQFSYRLMNYNPSNFAIICMKRDPIKIAASCVRFGADIHPWVLNWVKKDNSWHMDTSIYEIKRKQCAAVWGRKAISYIECQLEEMGVYEQRIKFFRKLQALGWPIDPVEASLVQNDEEERIDKRGRKVLWT